MKKLTLLAAGAILLATQTGCAQIPQGMEIAASTNGRAGTMPAFYDGNLFTINSKLLPSSVTLLAHNKSVNTIYFSDQFEAVTGTMFTVVIDAIQGDGYNPLWQQVQITFNPPSSAHQLTSDTQIDAEAAAGLINLIPTTNVFRCNVIGPK